MLYFGLHFHYVYLLETIFRGVDDGASVSDLVQGELSQYLASFARKTCTDIHYVLLSLIST